jgi:hypothetical protein
LGHVAGPEPKPAPKRKAPSPLSLQAETLGGVLAKTYAALGDALARVGEGVAKGDPEAARAALSECERLARTAASLSRAKDAPAEPGEEGEDAEDDGGEALLARIEAALEGGRQARRYEVGLIRERGLDPKEGWSWDDDAGDWVWDAAAALSRAARRPAPSDDAAAPDPP